MEVIKTDVAVMGSGVAGMGAAYKLANAGVKVAVFEKYPAQGGAVSNCPMSFCSTPDTPEEKYNNWYKTVWQPGAGVGG